MISNYYVLTKAGFALQAICENEPWFEAVDVDYKKDLITLYTKSWIEAKIAVPSNKFQGHKLKIIQMWMYRGKQLPRASMLYRSSIKGF